MQKVKVLVKKNLARKKPRLILLVFHAPVAWMVIRFYGLFDDEWYRMQYRSRKIARFQKQVPLMHYLLVGRQRGLSPSPFFVGEYYDPTRWNTSIIDPLLRYALQRNTWGRATSLLFDSSQVEVSGKFAPPLVGYLRKMRHSSNVPVYFDKKLGIDSSAEWLDIKKTMYEQINDRTKQLKNREITAPVRRFDSRREQSAIKDALKVKFRRSDLVSIVMPTWNREELIKEAIKSVQNQSYDNWELLIVDDGSTDRTVQVVKDFAKHDIRIKLLASSHGGVCKARNHGMEHALGKWVAFLDSDNTWTSNHLLTCLAALITKKKEAGYSAIKMDSNGDVRYRASEPDKQLLEAGNFIDLNALIVKKNLLDKVGYFDTNLRRMVDYDLVARISKVTDFTYIPVIGVNYTDHDNLVRISTTESLSWDGVVKNKNFIQWESALKNRDKDLVSIIIPMHNGVSHSIRTVRHILKSLSNEKVEIIIADSSANSSTGITMSQLQAIDSRIRYYRDAAWRDAVLAVNYGFIKSRGETIVVVNQHVIVEPGWLSPLISSLDGNSIYGPLQIQLNRTIGSMGVEYYGDNVLPVNILENHPINDAKNLKNLYGVDGLKGGCFAVRAGLFSHLHGLNPLYEGGFELQDFCHRARQLSARTQIKIAKQSVVINPDGGRGWYNSAQKQYIQDWARKIKSTASPLWETAGFKVLKYEAQHPENGDLSMVLPVLEAKKKQGKYRWAVKISAPADERRFFWGDLYYAEALAGSLERLGQHVAIDFHDHHERPTSYLDDIVLDLRGLDNTKPQAGKLNIMWVISHPDDVTVDMVQSFDIVYAAGKIWAEDMSKRASKPVEFMPQCTDTSRFYPPIKKEKTFAGKTLFVGNSRGVMRPIVRDAIKAGLDVAVYGGGWSNLIDSKYIHGTFIPNDKLAAAYGSAKVVLNDHWDDMRKWGFLSNRLFDITAAGGRAITDDIPGLYDVFNGEQVLTYSDKSTLSRKVQKLPSGMAQKAKLQQHRYIDKNHSFDARAKRIVADAIRSMEQK